MKICHIGIMGDIRKEGMITQYIFDNCIGNHEYAHIKGKIPAADIYILHCMKNILYLDDFITFKRPWRRVISLVHSSEPCMPSRYSDDVVVLTNTWQERFKKLYDINSKVIHGGIDLSLYNTKKDPDKLAFGKISRAEPGKFHQNWNEMIRQILTESDDVECRLICNDYKRLNLLKHKNMIYIDNIGISDHDKKIEELSKLSVYIECHREDGSTFVDTFNMSMLEAMALGIPVVMLRSIQEPMTEVLGSAGIICDTMEEMTTAIKTLLSDKQIRTQIGALCRLRAEDFSHWRMIEKWDDILEG